jgi:S-adenosylmethionine hydrolase
VNIITVLTDFGEHDPYVGIVKGVMLAINPRAAIVDITHEVEPQDVKEASFLVGDYYRYFPEGTIHLCVVDPTVGSTRKPLIVARHGHLFVGPDNGLFSLVLAKGEGTTREITNSRYMRATVSGTFHGRDIFAPSAAYLSHGIHPSEFGPAVESPVMLRDLFPTIEGDAMEGRIVRFDRFGNAISNIAYEFFTDFARGGPFTIDLCGLSFRALSTSYYEGRHTCLAGSSGYLEFGLFMGNLASERGIRKGEKVKVLRGLP